MTQKNLANWLKAMIISVCICALAVYALVLPLLCNQLVPFNRDFASRITWLILSWLTAVPFYIAMYFSWQISVHIGNDNSFSTENAVFLKRISILAIIDTGLIFAGNILLFILNMNNTGVLITTMLITFLGIVVSVVFAALSHLVEKAATLQEQSDLTI